MHGMNENFALAKLVSMSEWASGMQHLTNFKNHSVGNYLLSELF